MDLIIDVLPYITWIAVIFILFIPTSKYKKIKNLESRIADLEEKIKGTTSK